MGNQPGACPFHAYVQRESRILRAASLDSHRHTASSRPHDAASLLTRESAWARRERDGDSNNPKPRVRGLTENIEDNTDDERIPTRRHYRPTRRPYLSRHSRFLLGSRRGREVEVPPSSSKPPLWGPDVPRPTRGMLSLVSTEGMLPVVLAFTAKTSNNGGDNENETTTTKSGEPCKGRRKKLCRMLRKHGKCTRKQCTKLHTETQTETVNAQEVERQLLLPAPSDSRAVTNRKKTQDKDEQHRPGGTKKIAPVLEVQRGPQRMSRGLMDQIKIITSPDDSDSEDDLSSQDSGKAKTKTRPVQPKKPLAQPEISPLYQRNPPSKARSLRQHLAVAAMGDDKPIPLDLEAGIRPRSSLAVASAPARLSVPVPIPVPAHDISKGWVIVQKST
ncbi:hypothetical protein V8F20_006486 [Naviculisporaceae sp. PSN 640]